MTAVSNSGNPKLAIGGVGGSGTRVIAQLFAETGVNMGSDLNVSMDDLLFTLLFRRSELHNTSIEDIQQRLSLYTTLRAFGFDALSVSQQSYLESLHNQPLFQFDPAWVRKRIECAKVPADLSKSGDPWGWKEPNTHIFVETLLTRLPETKYIHVMRNGLDMAFSANQNQLNLWGQYYLGNHFEVSPKYSLKYWRCIHERINAFSSSRPNTVYILCFDSFCQNPKRETKKLLDFLGMKYASEKLKAFFDSVSVPASTNRYRNYPLTQFDCDDMDFVRHMGFL